MEAVVPRTLRSVSVVIVAASIFIGAAIYFIVGLLDGYMVNGTYGFLVVSGLIASLVTVPMSLRAVWGHVIKGFPVIGYHGGKFHYLRDGQLPVGVEAVRQVSVSKGALGGSVRFLGATGEELQRYPLILSSVDGQTVADRARRIAGLS